MAPETDEWMKKKKKGGRKEEERRRRKGEKRGKREIGMQGGSGGEMGEEIAPCPL